MSINIIATVLGIGKILWEFIKPLLVKETIKALEQILPVALEVVKEADKVELGQLADKGRLAADKVKAILSEKGVQVSMGLVNLSVELAVRKLRAEMAKEAK